MTKQPDRRLSVLSRSPLAEIPGETARAALSVFHPNNKYLRCGDQWSRLFEKVAFEPIKQSQGLLAASPVRLALITAFQFIEQLTDCQASEAVLVRVEWKYALHLPIFLPGMEPDILCNFRRLLIFHDGARESFDRLLDGLEKIDFLDAAGAQSADSVLRAVCTINRLERVMQSFLQALETLSIQQHEWMRRVILPHWYTRTFPTSKSFQLPIGEGPQARMARELAADIQYLLRACDTADLELGSLPEVRQLLRVFREQYEPFAGGPGQEESFRWRETRCVFFDNPPDTLLPLNGFNES